MYQFKKKGVKRKVSHNWRNILLTAIILITAILFISAPPATAQEPKGEVITTEEGSGIPVEKSPVMPEQEGYFIQRDAVKAVRNINDFHLLGLSEPEIIELSKLLKNEVYPKYPGFIPDLKQFYVDVNETLGLGLSEEQIDLLVEEITRPEDPGDFEIPLRPPKDSSAIEVIGRVPSDESAPWLTKKNRLFLFFVNDSNTPTVQWTEAQKQTARSRVEESETWFQNKDTLDWIDRILWAHYGTYDSPTEYTVNFTNSCSNSWMDTVAATHGYADLEALLRAQRTSFGDDYIVALFLIAKDARSQACPYLPEWGGGYGHWDERAIIFAYRGSGAALIMRDSGVYKHETLHLYGACDEYYSSHCNTGCGECLVTYPTYRATYPNEWNCEYCTETPVLCTMRSGAHADTNNDHMCCWTAGQIGWSTICITDCPSEALLKDDLNNLEVLTRLRDQILSKNAQGKQIIEGYYAHSSELTRILLTHPSYGKRAARLIYSFMPEFRRILAKGKVTVKKRKIREVARLLNDLSRSADPELKEFLIKMKRQVNNKKLLRQFGVRLR